MIAWLWSLLLRAARFIRTLWASDFLRGFLLALFMGCAAAVLAWVFVTGGPR